MASGLRVAVPAALTEVNPKSGVGRIWVEVLAGLAARLELRPLNPGRRIRRRHRPDVWLSDCGMGAIPVDGPLVVQVPEAGWDDPQVRATLDPHFLEVVLEGRVGDAVRAAAHIITPSESARRQVIEHWDVAPDRVHAVPLGVDRDRFRPGLAGGPALVETAGGRADRPYVLFVSQIHPRKNLAALREAMVVLADHGFPHHLVVVGGAAQDRPDSRALDRDAGADLPGHPGRVVRIWEVSETDLARLLAGADAFCLPSLMEGFGLTALEAMSCGVPVVVSDRGSLPEVVGDAGIVVPPTPEALAAALAGVLGDRDRRRALGEAARQRAVDFTWERTVDGWLAVLEVAAGGAGRQGPGTHRPVASS